MMEKLKIHVWMDRDDPQAVRGNNLPVSRGKLMTNCQFIYTEYVSGRQGLPKDRQQPLRKGCKILTIVYDSIVKCKNYKCSICIYTVL